MKAFHAAGAAQLPGFAQMKTYAAHPVWRGSTTAELKCAPMSRQERAKIWWDAQRFERQTRQPGKQNGKLSRVGLAVLHALLFEFLNVRTGRLDPSYAAIAEKAGVSLSSVYRGLTRLRAAGVLNWVRRCRGVMIDGRFILEQDSNAYAVLPSSTWRHYRQPPAPPPPDPTSWGKAPWDAKGAAMHASSGPGGESLADAMAQLKKRRPPAGAV